MEKGKERLRGVRASRAKLDKALAQAALSKKTQAAVAEKIADVEHLDAAPRDLVNRIFREHAVDPQSIERVANVLGVEAYTLYQAEGDRSFTPLEKSQPTTKLFLFSILTIVVLATLIFLNQDTQYACQIKSLLHRPQVEDNKLGVFVARFTNDPQRAGQNLIANLFAQDATLAPKLNVLTGCQEFSDLGSGDFQKLQSANRKETQQELHNTGAHIALWGNRFGDKLTIRFTSTLPDSVSQRIEDGDKTMAVNERYVELQLDLTDLQATSTELKKLTLSLMHSDKPALTEIRDEALQAFVSSFEWLRRSILADRNLQASLDPNLNQQQWAIVSAQLCYKYRLLGDYEAKPELYHQAVSACEDMLQFRSREQYPLDWSATKTNLASTHIRLAMYDASTEQAIARLQKAAKLFNEAALEIDVEIAPQLWAINRRNLGTLHLRLASLTDESSYQNHYYKAVELLELSLTFQDPSFQPEDWADTQQNLCAVKYQYGSRVNSEVAVGITKQAVAHCEEAIRWLSLKTSGVVWARAQNNLAASNAVLAGLTHNSERLIQARSAFMRAQEVYRRDTLPLNWAEVEVNLGQLNCTLALMAKDINTLSAAREHTEKSLEIFIEKNHRYSAHAQGQLDAILNCRIKGWAECACEP